MKRWRKREVPVFQLTLINTSREAIPTGTYQFQMSDSDGSHSFRCDRSALHMKWNFIPCLSCDLTSAVCDEVLLLSVRGMAGFIPAKEMPLL